jgi:hypothetical protein
MKKQSKKYLTVYDRPEYSEMKALNDKLLDKDSRLGKIISAESLRQSSDQIYEAMVQSIVNNGHGVRIQHT